MANTGITIKRGTKTEIDATPIVDGQLLFTTDQVLDNKFYVDLAGSRVAIGGRSMASEISYSGTTSGLIATTTQGAIDEVVNTLKTPTGKNSLGIFNNGVPVLFTSGQNLDTLTSGTYYSTGSTLSGTLINTPFSSSFRLECSIMVDTLNSYQMAYDTAGCFRYRVQAGGTWGAWIGNPYDAPSILNTGSNLNDFKTDGSWYTNGPTLSSSILNSPFGNNAFRLYVTTLSSSVGIMVSQMCFNIVQGIKYERFFDGQSATWSSWIQVQGAYVQTLSATASSGFTFTINSLKKRGTHVEGTLQITSTNALTSGTGYNLATLPSGTYDTSVIKVVLASTNLGITGFCQITSAGNVFFTPYGNLAAGGVIRIGISYDVI